jgi:hypothetical protein
MKLAALAALAAPHACVMGGQTGQPAYAAAVDLPPYARQGDAPGLPPIAARPWPASTESLPAQLWIELGLARFLASDRDGAAEAFRTAQRHDPTCAICFWGEALAGSPGPEGAAAPGAEAALSAALAMEGRATDKEAAVIAALDVRFHGPRWEMELASQRGRDHAYAGEMRAVAARFPGDWAIAALARAAQEQAAAWR